MTTLLLRPSGRSTLALGLLFGALACSDSTPTDADARRGDDSSAIDGLGGPLPPARSAEHCDGRIGAGTVDQVVVPSGARCLLDGTRVEGNVLVKTDGRLETRDARIDGNIQAEDAHTVTTRQGTVVEGDIQVKRRAVTTVEGTVVGGNLQVEEGGASLTLTGGRIRGDLQFAKAAAATITGVEIDGNLQLTGNRDALAAEGNVVFGNLQIFENRGGVLLVANRVAQNLQCGENRPAPTGSGNVAGEKEDQCEGL